MDDEPMLLVRLVGRQKRPQTGDVFRLRIVDGDYYFGLVIEGYMPVGPMAPGSILCVVFSESSVTGFTEDLDELCSRPLLMPPCILNQRLWTIGYAEKIGTTSCTPPIDYIFENLAFGTFVDRYKGQVATPSDKKLVGTWGTGNEYTMSLEVAKVLRGPKT